MFAIAHSLEEARSLVWETLPDWLRLVKPWEEMSPDDHEHCAAYCRAYRDLMGTPKVVEGLCVFHLHGGG